MSKEQILPFNYIKGEEFTEVLKEVTGCRTFLDMAELLDVPKATFSAWKLHERTSHELIVRLHLAKGIPIKKLALGIDEEESNSAKAPYLTSHLPSQYAGEQRGTIILESFCLTNGELVDTGEVPYSIRRINGYGLNGYSLMEVETNEAIYLVDKDTRNAVSGKYLIDIDGNLSINHIQRLPGKKLAIAFGDTTMEVSDSDIKVMGRVAVISSRT
ncbi:helix-turn-helix domain-containing protein [Vibrio parahaemolyticus]|uniref:helix-turn-helix domain-containing protein n=1 Tax=Vibrio antiquarius (strain Ex25) TaxID=150340 RepID=UPI002657B40B|nr:helix-turn-helix domain-containing protein [Vibrio antiquarius]MCR9546900.1 helix-turn-helix domain-containing protein [Vibrio antiquarius]